MKFFPHPGSKYRLFSSSIDPVGSTHGIKRSFITGQTLCRAIAFASAAVGLMTDSSCGILKLAWLALKSLHTVFTAGVDGILAEGYSHWQHASKPLTGDWASSLPRNRISR